MTQAEFNKLNKAIDKMANDIMGDKGPEYTLMHDDVLNNFKSTAKQLKLEPLQVWGVFLHKHIQSILSHSTNPNMHQAEPIESRYCDAINYLTLGYALYIDLLKERHEDLNLIYKSIE